jgi:hypothetical protein
MQYLKAQAIFSGVVWITVEYINKLVYLKCTFRKMLISIIYIIFITIQSPWSRIDIMNVMSYKVYPSDEGGKDNSQPSHFVPTN